MSDINGNLALKKKKQPLKTCRIPVSATPDPNQAYRLRVQAIRREMTRRRLQLLSTLVILVLLVAGVFAMIVYRQAQILELNFSAVAMEQKIRLYEKESSQIKEALAQKTNFDLIRQQAISRLGLQDPARVQIVRVHIPDTDRIIYARQGIAGTDDAAWLAGAYTTIEGYFKTINIGEPGD